MLNSRLPYKFFLMFLVFSVVLIVPFFLSISSNIDQMLGKIEDIELLSPEQRGVYLTYSQRQVDDLIAFSFYIFVLAFVVSMFFSQKFISPVKDLHRVARSIMDGDLDVRIDSLSGDEFGDVIKAFNEMAESLKRKDRKISRGQVYLNAVLDPILVINGDNEIMDINPAFTRVFGYETNEAVGASVFDFLDDESERTLRRQLYGGGPGMASSYKVEVSIISKYEGLVPVLLNCEPFTEEGAVVGIIGTIRDLREEMALRSALEKETAYSDMLMDSIADRMLVVDRGYTILKANLAARVAAGRDITGEDCHKVFHGSMERCFLHGEECPARTVFDTGKVSAVVHEHLEEGGRKAYQEITAFPVKEIDGEVMQVVETIRDVTDRRRFEEEIKHRNMELTTLNSISKILGESLRADEIFNRVLDKVIGLLGMDGGGIFFLDEYGRDLQCRFHRGLTEDFVNSIVRLRMGEDIPGKVAVTGEPVIAADISREKRAENSILKHTGLKGFACMPIRGKERLIGVFFIFSIKGHEFSAGERSTLNSIGEMLGLAFENISLYEKMRDLYEHQRMRRAEEQRTLLNLSTMLSSTLETNRVLASCLLLIKNSSRADMVWLLEADESASLVLRTCSGCKLKEGRIVYSKDAGSIELYSMKRRETVKVKDIVSETKFYLHDSLKGFNSAYSVPVLIGEKSLGAFGVYFSVAKTLTDEEIHFLQTVSSVLAVALERAGLYESAIIQREMSDAILQSIADGVISVDVDGVLVSINGAAESILGVKGDELRGAHIRRVFGVEGENPEFFLRLDECLSDAKKGVVRGIEANVVTIGKQRLPLTVKSAPVKDNRGEIAGVVLVLRDLSREKQVDMMKSDFLRSVSHEFRTPLTAIVGMTEMVLKGDVTGERVNEYLRSMHEEGMRLSDMVTDVLDVARIESGKEVFKESEIDFRELLRDVKGSFDTVIRKKEIKYSATVKGGGSFRGDREKIKQLMRNLLDNAVTYSDNCSAVDLLVDVSEEGLMITVSDKGWGIPPDELAHMGEKFFRGKKARRNKGTGLGLSLCKDIVRMHGGELNIKSKPGEGTTVTVDLPARRDA